MGECVARDGGYPVAGEVELHEVGEVPEAVPVQAVEAAAGEAHLLEVQEAPGGEHVAAQAGHLVTGHLQDLNNITLK